MKVYLDENMPPFAAQPLAQVYPSHEFRTPDDENLRGVEDIPLMSTLREHGFEAIITRDRAQLKDVDERRAVAESGLRWIGVPTKNLKGLEQVTVTVSTLIVGLRFVFEHQPTVPTSYQLKSIPHTESQRIAIRDIVIPPAA